jgi:hypothetical protein
LARHSDRGFINNLSLLVPHHRALSPLRAWHL